MVASVKYYAAMFERPMDGDISQKRTTPELLSGCESGMREVLASWGFVKHHTKLHYTVPNTGT